MKLADIYECDLKDCIGTGTTKHKVYLQDRGWLDLCRRHWDELFGALKFKKGVPR